MRINRARGLGVAGRTWKANVVRGPGQGGGGVSPPNFIVQRRDAAAALVPRYCSHPLLITPRGEWSLIGRGRRGHSGRCSNIMFSHVVMCFTQVTS
jgi:hypothetical protein